MSTNSQYPPHPHPHPHPDTYSSPPLSVVLTVCLLVFFFVGFFFVYFCRCFIDNVLHTWNLRRSPSGNLVSSSNSPNNPGLDPSLKQFFPTITYSCVKKFGREKYGLECAICLAEFNDDDSLRLLTVCYHVFHQECIDLWLESHKTCPVCRGNLDLPLETLAKCPILVHDNTIRDISEGSGSSDDAISIVIKHDVDEGRGERSEQGTSPNTMQQNERRENMERFSRSHSTGHSMVRRTREEEAGSHSTGHSIVRRTREEEDRYTLRLPEYVKIKITREHNWTKSSVTFGDFSNPTVIGNGGFGEVSGSSGGDINKV